jgi:hypothetical protein
MVAEVAKLNSGLEASDSQIISNANSDLKRILNDMENVSINSAMNLENPHYNVEDPFLVN